MTPDERQLITGLFDRMNAVETPAKDRDADLLIHDAVRQIPDAPYLLVQSVLVQEQALKQADARIRELEEQTARLDPSAGHGSFLGGARRPPPQTEGSVPTAGAGMQGAPSYRSQPERDIDPTAKPTGGGFLASALSTAAGVTGGMLLADSIRNMFGGNQARDALGTLGVRVGPSTRRSPRCAR